MRQLVHVAHRLIHENHSTEILGYRVDLYFDVAFVCPLNTKRFGRGINQTPWPAPIFANSGVAGCMAESTASIWRALKAA